MIPASASPPLSECPDCGGTGFIGYDAPVGHQFFGKLQPCQNQQHSRNRLSRFQRLSQLTDLEKRRRLADIGPVDGNQESLDAVHALVEKPRGWLYLWGSSGNAKSDLLVAAVNELNLAGRGPAMYVKFSRLCNVISEAFTERKYRDKMLNSGVSPASAEWDNLGYLDRYDLVVNIKILAIDEFDKARYTELREEFRFDFLDDRWRQAVAGETATLFASQTPPNDKSESNPIASRFLDNRFVVVENKAGDARRTMEWED